MGEKNQNVRIESARAVDNRNFCPQLPGTLIRISIPPGAEINILNLIEISSPSGICFIVRSPLLAGGANLNVLADAVRQAGGCVEFM
jgi:hypothetical protein